MCPFNEAQPLLKSLALKWLFGLSRKIFTTLCGINNTTWNNDKAAHHFMRWAAWQFIVKMWTGTIIRPFPSWPSVLQEHQGRRELYQQRYCWWQEFPPSCSSCVLPPWLRLQCKVSNYPRITAHFRDKMCQVFLVQLKPLTNTTMSISFVFTFEYITWRMTPKMLCP